MYSITVRTWENGMNEIEKIHSCDLYDAKCAHKHRRSLRIICLELNTELAKHLLFCFFFLPFSLPAFVVYRGLGTLPKCA